MVNFNGLTKLSQLIHTLLLTAIFFTLSTFAWLGVYEFKSIKEIHHIVATDFKQITIPEAEIQTHLNNHIKNSHIVLSGVITVAIIMGSIWFFTIIYFRRLQNIKLDETLLDELLYYNELNELHKAANNLPLDLKKLQANREKFLVQLQKSLTSNQFVLYYQPIINISTGKIVDIEALVRWQHPTHGLLSPAVFLPLCENTGFILPLGEWVLQTACQQLNKWQQMGFSQLRMSVNLSTRQLKDHQLLQRIKNLLAENKIAPHCLKLEITETSLMKDIPGSITILKSLREMGLQLSLDDFGTGYSSLHYLKQFPVTNLKIDKSFINDMTSNITSLAIVESVIKLGRSLGLTITAEGIENNNQLSILKNMNCDLVQGYWYSQPVSAEAFAQLLHAADVRDNLDTCAKELEEDKNLKPEIVVWDSEFGGDGLEDI